MIPRLVIAGLVGLTVLGAAALAWYGVRGESAAVVSTRVGSPGGGYGFAGGVK